MPYSILFLDMTGTFLMWHKTITIHSFLYYLIETVSDHSPGETHGHLQVAEVKLIEEIMGKVNRSVSHFAA